MSYRLHYAPDNASLIIRLALDLLGQPFETVLVDRSTKAQKSAGYLAMNPHGRIPVLETPEGPMFETGAILLWLGDRYGGLGPGPADAGRGDYLKWLFFVSNTLHANLAHLFYVHRITGRDETAQKNVRDHLAGILKTQFGTLNDLASEGHDWIGAQQPRALDLYICACMRWADLYPTGYDRWFHASDFPSLMNIARRVDVLPAAQRLTEAEGLGARPFSQPEPCNPPKGSAL